MDGLTREAQRQRVVIDLGELGLAEVPLLGLNIQSAAEDGLAPHRHPGLMEICCLKRGELVFRVRGEDFRLHGREVFVTQPDERHGTGRNPFGPSVLYWIQLRLRPARGFLLLPGREAGALVAALREVPRRFGSSARLEQLFEELVRRAQAGRADTLGRLRLASLVQRLLFEVLDCAERAESAGPSEEIGRVLEWIDRDPAQRRRISDLARRAHLSESRFQAKFKEQTGFAPGEYMLRRRVEAAALQLEHGGDSITVIAHRCGFSSSQHFATAFRKFTNCSPGEWRRRAQDRDGASQ